MKVTFQIENAAPVVIEGNPGDNLLATSISAIRCLRITGIREG